MITLHYGRGVDKRFESRSRLTLGLNGAVKLVLAKILAADHRQYISGLIVDADKGSLNLLELIGFLVCGTVVDDIGVLGISEPLGAFDARLN